MAATTREEIEEQVRNLQQKKKKLQDGGADEEDEANKVGLGAEGHYDTDIYSAHGKFEGYVTSIAPNEELDDDDDIGAGYPKRGSSYTAPLNFLNDTINDKDFDPMAEHRAPKIADREGEYRARMRQRIISPPRYDPFADAPENQCGAACSRTSMLK